MDPLLTEALRNFLAGYEAVTGPAVIHHLQQLAAPLRGAKVVHVNASRATGAVAEILQKLIPFKQALGIEARWETISGDALFQQGIKGLHDALQGEHVQLSDRLLSSYEATNAENAERLRSLLEEADFVFIHDPQPAALLHFCDRRRGKWIWRCHLDVSHPYRPVWKYLQQWLLPYEAAIFSLPEFAQALPYPQYIIPPSIDPLSEKNIELPPQEIEGVRARFGIDAQVPLIVQVAPFERFKDPLGVIEAYRLVRKHIPLQLVLAGDSTSDDAEGAAVLDEVRRVAGGDPHIHVLPLPADAPRLVNALQRSADIVMRKSLREGFGLAVAEGLWKGKPVIAGDTGGLRLQVVNHYTGFLVNTPEGAALRIRYLLHRRDLLEEMGARGRRFVRENFLLTRHLREYLTMMVGLQHGRAERIEVGAGAGGPWTEGD
jgi:trehalose synthase